LSLPILPFFRTSWRSCFLTQRASCAEHTLAEPVRVQSRHRYNDALCRLGSIDCCGAAGYFGHYICVRPDVCSPSFYWRPSPAHPRHTNRCAPGGFERLPKGLRASSRPKEYKEYNAVAARCPVRYQGRNAPVAQLDRPLPSEGLRKSSSESTPERTVRGLFRFAN
jgi:hypothetical protein